MSELISPIRMAVPGHVLRGPRGLWLCARQRHPQSHRARLERYREHSLDCGWLECRVGCFFLHRRRLERYLRPSLGHAVWPGYYISGCGKWSIQCVFHGTSTDMVQIIGATAQKTTTVAAASTIVGFGAGVAFVAYPGISELLPNKYRCVLNGLSVLIAC